MGHDRKLVIGGVALVKIKLKHDILVMSSIRDEIEKVLIESSFLADAPFKWISLVIRFGLENKFDPIYKRVNKAYGDLPISIEVDTKSLIGADPDKMKSILRRATIEALLHVAGKYNLPTKALQGLNITRQP